MPPYLTAPSASGMLRMPLDDSVSESVNLSSFILNLLPFIVTLPTLRVESLMKVSVVENALQASSQLVLPVFAMFAKLLVIFSAGSGTPITPVLATKTSDDEQPSNFAVASTVFFIAVSPTLPVNALEFPALAMNARALPVLRDFLHQSTAEERVLDLVKTPATDVPLSKLAMKKSGEPFFLMPQMPERSCTPSISGSLGKVFGASGDTVNSAMAILS
jgi:hypothetical protein